VRPEHEADVQTNQAPPLEMPVAEQVLFQRPCVMVPVPEATETRRAPRTRIVEDDLIGGTHTKRVYEDGALVSEGPGELSREG
jgi:hypothetical protein